MKRILLIITLLLGQANIFSAGLTRSTSSESLPATWTENPEMPPIEPQIITVNADPSAIIVQWDRSTASYKNNGYCKNVLTPTLCTLGMFTSYTIYLACMWAKLDSDQKNSFHNDIGFFMGENFKNYDYNNPAFYFNLTLIIGTITAALQCTHSYCKSR